MITLCRRAFVSIVATMPLTLALGGCVSAAPRPLQSRQVSTVADLLSIRFDNLSRAAVDVYLVGTTRQWILGRVPPGAIVSLRLPDDAFAERAMMVRLAVLPGEKLTFAPGRDPRAFLTVAQPASAILLQRWTFSQGNLMSLPY
jgi:hypothetical protein